MTTYISILRGVNVGGSKKIKMDLLRQMFVDMGFSLVQSYIQSGNLIFQSNDVDKKLLEEKIANGILTNFGYKVPVIVLKAEEMKNIIQKNPFIGEETKDVSFLHVTFLSSIPEKTSLDNLKTANYGVDEFELIEKAIYLYCPAGYGNTKLTNSFFENKLKLTATTRNWKTVNELASMSNQ